MMQSGSKKTCLVILVVIILIISRQAEAQLSEAASAFMTCYSSCFIVCYLTPGHTTSDCSLECLKNCIIPRSTLLNLDANENASTSLNKTNIVTPDQFCKLGCASILCSNISTNKNPQVVKVAKCVGSCSNMCTRTKNSHSSP